MRCPWTGGAHSLRFTSQSLLWDSVLTTHSFPSCLFSSLPCHLSFSILSISLSFFRVIFSLFASPPAPAASITALSRPSVVFPAYPDLLLFFFKAWQACIHKWFGAYWPMFHTLLHQLSSRMESGRAEWNTKGQNLIFFKWLHTVFLVLSLIKDWYWAIVISCLSVTLLLEAHFWQCYKSWDF